jgi:hypothetical protein
MLPMSHGSVARPFAFAFVGCIAYFAVIFAVMSALRLIPSPVLYLVLVMVPVVACWIYQRKARLNADSSSFRRRLAAVAFVVVPPVVGWYLAGFAIFAFTGWGF